MSCHCNSGSVPPYYPGLPAPGNSYYCHGTKSGNGVAVYDDNENIRPLLGTGIVFSDGDTTYYTDGSDEAGKIDLNPKPVSSVDRFLALVGNKLVSIGNAQDYADGTTFVRKAGQWVPTPISELKRTFDPADLRIGGKQLISFSCSSGGLVEFAKFVQTPNTFLYFNATGEATTLTPAQLTETLLIPACETIPKATDEDEIEYLIGCSQNGLVKTIGETLTYYHDPIVRIYYQGKTLNNPGGSELITAELRYYPDLPAVQSGSFNDEIVDIDLKLQQGYSDKATAVVISANALIAIADGLSNQRWFLVVVIKGIERIRITAGQGAGVNSANAQFVVPMPADKKLRIDVQRQSFTGGAIAEFAYAAVYLEGFLFS